MGVLQDGSAATIKISYHKQKSWFENQISLWIPEVIRFYWMGVAEKFCFSMLHSMQINSPEPLERLEWNKSSVDHDRTETSGDSSPDFGQKYRRKYEEYRYFPSWRVHLVEDQIIWKIIG